MNKVVEKSAAKDKPKQAPEKVEEEAVEEEVVSTAAPQPVDPFLNRKAARLAAVQLQVDGPKPVITSDVTDEEKKEEEE